MILHIQTKMSFTPILEELLLEMWWHLLWMGWSSSSSGYL